MQERITFFDQVYGIGLRIAAGSGRSWMDQPGGDPQHAHCQIDLPGDTLLPSTDLKQRLTSGVFFLAWDDVLRFADELTDLAVAPSAETASLGDRSTRLSVRIRPDGRLRAEAVIAQGHHVAITVRCQTLWDWHFGVREDLPALAARLRSAVSKTRPPNRQM
ncbi:hypothetical protein [Phytoactinopolyspora limicola]|uniref:hypothetical protein n=1 Tax=Phytoactinopolyspora limicola TaxID=2715536 RepID=UPI00140966CD|nr:hypothetical protein [Phytoactinopolyspora limicola]